VIKKHIVLIIPGLGNEVWLVRLLTNHWRHWELEPEVLSVDWQNSESFNIKFTNLNKKIDQFLKNDCKVSLIGISAGGSAALNLFSERSKDFNKVINVCGRLKTGPRIGWRSFSRMTASSPAFAQSVKLFEKQGKLLTRKDREKIMTVRAKFGDELVPCKTTILDGATNIQIPTIEHSISIYLSLTIFSNRLINFLIAN